MNDFEKEMLNSGVSPLKKNNRVILKKPLPPKVSQSTNDSNTQVECFNSAESFHISTQLTGNETIEFSQNGVQPKTIKKMKQGKLEEVPPCLDLHGYKLEEAKIKLSKFVNQSQRRYLQIIHGKGHHSSEKFPILKNLVASYLKNHRRVLAVCSCPIDEGGAGAVFVLLKK